MLVKIKIDASLSTNFPYFCSSDVSVNLTENLKGNEEAY